MASAQKPKRFLTAEQKYDLWVRMLCGQITQAAAAAEAGVDRGVIIKIRAVARDAAIAALQTSRPGKPAVNKVEQAETVRMAAEIARLQHTIVEQAIELAVLRGKTGWD
jgi:hypothetical protein